MDAARLKNRNAVGRQNQPGVDAILVRTRSIHAALGIFADDPETSKVARDIADSRKACVARRRTLFLAGSTSAQGTSEGQSLRNRRIFRFKDTWLHVGQVIALAQTMMLRNFLFFWISGNIMSWTQNSEHFSNIAIPKARLARGGHRKGFARRSARYSCHARHRGR